MACSLTLVMMRTSAAVALSVLASAVLAGSSAADTPLVGVAPPTLTVADAGSEGQRSEVPQAPVTVVARGVCASPFTTTASCPDGSWPGFGADWRPTVDVAGGDVLALAFSDVVTDVKVAATSNFDPNIRPPAVTPPPGGGPPGPQPPAPQNSDEVPVTAATPAETDPRQWTVTLPRLGFLAMYTLPFSVVATDAGGTPRDYALSIRSPRASRPGQPCGSSTFFFNPGDVRSGRCDGPPPGHPFLPGFPPTVPTRGSPTPVPPRSSAADTLRLVGQPRWTKRGLRLVVFAPRRGRLRLAVHAGTRPLGRLAPRAAVARGRATFVIEVAARRRPDRGPLRVTLVLRTSAGTVTATRTVRPA